MIRERGGDSTTSFSSTFRSDSRGTWPASSPWGKRPEQLRAAKALLEKAQEAEIASVSTDLGKLGIDWSAAPTDQKNRPEAADFEVKVETDRKGDTVTSGEPMQLKVTVKNKGKPRSISCARSPRATARTTTKRSWSSARSPPASRRRATTPLGWCEIEGRKPGTTEPLPQNAKRICRLPMDAVTAPGHRRACVSLPKAAWRRRIRSCAPR